ncbi:MAG: DUF4160 domain-containing protein [Ignavibacteria bacterium]
MVNIKIRKAKQSKAEFVVVNGEVKEIRMANVKGKRPLEGKELHRFRRLVNYFKDDIVKKWIDFFVLNKPIHSEKITGELD